ncbi:MAG: tripartite tricarboxylate transporter TctB family protein [Burkholderiaceae bacterium]|nr:tripartite tricarboxylate transporter TctB family protein [Burkholderiaceae bacterium]
MTNHSNDDRPAATYRTMELAVAVLAFLFGAIVVIDSARLGSGWADDGPQAGYFPFYIGLIICAGSAWIFVRALAARRPTTSAFVEPRPAQAGR